jgi:hypothetical protein
MLVDALKANQFSSLLPIGEYFELEKGISDHNCTLIYTTKLASVFWAILSRYEDTFSNILKKYFSGCQ